MATPRTSWSRSKRRRIFDFCQNCLSVFDQKEWGTRYVLLIDILITTLNLINILKDQRSHLKWPSNPPLNGDTSDVLPLSCFDICLVNQNKGQSSASWLQEIGKLGATQVHLESRASCSRAKNELLHCSNLRCSFWTGFAKMLLCNNLNKRQGKKLVTVD